MQINTMLFSMSFPQLRVLQELALESDNCDSFFAEYRVTAIILDIAHYRLFKPVRGDVPVDPPKYLTKIEFIKKAIDTLNLPAILRSKSVAERIPIYFRNREPTIIFCYIKLCNGVNNMWVLKICTCLSSLDQLDVCIVTLVETYDFPILCTSVPHKLLKSQIAALVHNSSHYTQVKVGQRKWYFVNSTNGSGGKHAYSKSDSSTIGFSLQSVPKKSSPI